MASFRGKIWTGRDFFPRNHILGIFNAIEPKILDILEEISSDKLLRSKFSADTTYLRRALISMKTDKINRPVRFITTLAEVVKRVNKLFVFLWVNGLRKKHVKDIKGHK